MSTTQESMMRRLRFRMPRGPRPDVARPSDPRPAVVPEPEQTRRDFYTYGINFLALAAGATANGAIAVEADSEFEVQKLAYFADIAAAVQTESTRVLPLVTVQITDTGTGRPMFSIPLAIPSIMGDGRIPFLLPTTKVFTKRASIAVAVVNFSAATAYNLRLVLIGSKIFSYG